MRLRTIILRSKRGQFTTDYWLPSFRLLLLTSVFLLTAGNPELDKQFRLYKNCYREVTGCEKCKDCNNKKTNEECACLVPEKGNDSRLAPICDEWCVSGDATSVGNIQNWRSFGITLMAICCSSIFVLFLYTMAKWYQTDTSEPKVATLEERVKETEEEKAGPSEPEPEPQPPPPLLPPPPQAARIDSGDETGTTTSSSSYESSTDYEEVLKPPIMPPPPPGSPPPPTPKLSTAIA